MEWSTNFASEYERIYRDRFSKNVTEKQAAFVAKFIPPRGRVADVPCGFGRHAEALAELGYIVHGVDLYQIQEAKKRLSEKDSEVRNRITYEVGDMRTWKGHGDFDAYISLFSSFGYFSDEENERVIQNAAASVRIGGIIALDVRNPVATRIEFESNQWQIKPQTKEHFDELATYDPVSNIETIRFIVDGREIHASWKHYSPDELKAFFLKYKCAIIGMYGSYSGDSYLPLLSRRLIIIARRENG